MSIDHLFFELIQVAIDNRVCLSHTPSADEWGELYAIAKKQSLVGVCFASVQKLQQQQQEPPEMLFLTWMGMAAKIQQRNEVVNRQCVELQAKLSADGFKSCILKGQGVAAAYGDLSLLRQSGDIDVWVMDDRDKVIDYVKKVCGVEDLHTTLVHIDMPCFADTEVEVHFTPSILRNPFKNRMFQTWALSDYPQDKTKVIESNGNRMTVLSDTFNIIFLLSHAFKHLINEGVGMRQAMDVYFVLQSAKIGDEDKEYIMQKLNSFGMAKFAQGLMWVMRHVFIIEEERLICTPNATHGQYILKELLACGNFGHEDSRLESNDLKSRSWLQLKRNVEQFSYYPGEIFGSFFWRFKSFFGFGKR